MCFVLGAVTGCELLTTDVFSQRRARSHLGAVKGALAGDVSPSQRLAGPPRPPRSRHSWLRDHTFGLPRRLRNRPTPGLGLGPQVRG